MTLTAAHADQMNSFRAFFEDALQGDSRFVGVSRHDRPEGSIVATRWQTAANPSVWLEIAVRPQIPQIRVGIVTDDRWKSEDFEEKIEESGDTMSEFVEMGFEEAGLRWLDPLVEHFREDLKYFYFSTAEELTSVEALADPGVRRKTRQMFDGYYYAFGPFLK